MKKVIILLLCFLAIALLYIFGSGLCRNSEAYIGEYSVTPDGQLMTMYIGVSGSVGSIRRVETHIRDNDDVLDLDCYNAFGGINGSLGACSVYTISLPENIRRIALYCNDGTYQTVLVKGVDGVWERMSQATQ